MLTIIENGDVYAPEPRGKQSIVIAAGRIAKLGAFDTRAVAPQLECEVIDATGCVVTPGLIDSHVHLIGGSGEEGFATQTPAMSATELVAGGTTTVVGTLGTDTTTRTMPALLASVKAMRDMGLSAWAWTGGYDARPLTSSVRDDMVLIDEIIGAGELAIADRRGAQFDARELARLAADCYIAGTLTGKAGLLHLHVGPDDRRLSILRQVLDDYAVDAHTLYPTHVERNEALMREAIELTRRGMPIDVDVYEEDLVKWVRFYRAEDGDPKLLTASSDAAIKSPHVLLAQIRACVHEGVLPLEEALALATNNTARILKLRDDGAIAAGNKANLLVLDAKTLELRHVIANGKIVVRDGRVILRERALAKSDRKIHLEGEKTRNE